MKMSKVKNLWKLIACDEKSVHELRAFNPETGETKTQLFNPAQGTPEEKKRAFEDAATRYNSEGYNCYVVMNPIREDFRSGSVKDKHIRCRRLLLIDIDRACSSKQPALNKEVKAAKKLGKKIIAYLAALGWPKPIRVASGNGLHIYYQLDELANDNETTELIRQTLKLLAKKFNNSTVEIDTCVFNASRITRIPGTVNYKGKETEDRPYRMAVLHG